MLDENVLVEKQISVTEKLQTRIVQDGDMLESLLSHLGGMGRYQKLLFIGMMPFAFGYAYMYFVQIFITVTPQNHWCRVPELANLSMELRLPRALVFKWNRIGQYRHMDAELTKSSVILVPCHHHIEKWTLGKYLGKLVYERNLSAPGASTGNWDRCKTFDTNWSTVLDTLLPPPLDTPVIHCQHGWEFEFTDIPYETVASEREWVCDRASYVPTAQSVFFLGSVVGGFLFGWIADRFGRIPALIGTNLIGAIGSIASIFTSGLWDFVFCRFLVGMSFDNCFMIMLILVLEYVGPEYRTLVANIGIALFFGAAVTTLPWIAYYIADWRTLSWITSVHMFFVIFVPWLLPESVRWLASTGHINEAVKVLRKFERVNKVKIPDDVLAEFIISAQLEKKQSFFTVFKSSLLVKSLIGMVVAYLASTMVIDGLVRLSDSFGSDFFMMFCLTSATEIPAILLLAAVLDRWGRRNLTWAPLAISGFLICVTVFVNKGLPQSSLAITARFFVNVSYAATTQWCIELLPTPFRASGSAALHLMGYFGTILSPFIVYSERYWSVLPLIILAVMSLIAGGVSVTLPETNGQPMPQTIADSEKIIREQSLCRKPEDPGDVPYKRKPSVDA